VKTLPVSFVLLVFAANGFAQTPGPAQGPVQVAQMSGGASPGVGASPGKPGVMSTLAAVVGTAVAAAAAVATSNTTMSANHH